MIIKLMLVCLAGLQQRTLFYLVVLGAPKRTEGKERRPNNRAFDLIDSEASQVLGRSVDRPAPKHVLERPIDQQTIPLRRERVIMIEVPIHLNIHHNVVHNKRGSN